MVLLEGVQVIDLVNEKSYRCKSGRYDPATKSTHPPDGAKMWKGIVDERHYPSGMSSASILSVVLTPFGPCVAHIDSFQSWATIGPVTRFYGTWAERARELARLSGAPILVEEFDGPRIINRLIDVAAEDMAEQEKKDAGWATYLASLAPLDCERKIITRGVSAIKGKGQRRNRRRR